MKYKRDMERKLGMDEMKVQQEIAQANAYSANRQASSAPVATPAPAATLAPAPAAAPRNFGDDDSDSDDDIYDD